MTAKLWANENLNHACSTDTVLGVDDYVGKEWVFYWQYGNYIKDEYGVKHITAIRGVTGGTVATPSGTFNIPAFDQTPEHCCIRSYLLVCCKDGEVPASRWYMADS